MSQRKQKRRKPTLADGLVSFYSSQAELMLAQYRNINQLLGTTTDWTHPGTHCEVLLRDFLRRNLLQWMSVDKGYIYGRVKRGGRESHCPEIDVLIHNTRDYSPLFRVDDFVIVQPEAVLGIIQVKRSFRKVRNESPLEKGLRQVTVAKQHLVDLLIEMKMEGRRTFEVSDLLTHSFSGVVAFDKDGKVSLEQAITERYRSHLAENHYPDSQVGHNASLFVLPTFVGSLQGKCAYGTGKNYPRCQYYVYDSRHEEGNIGLQLLLCNILQRLSTLSDPLKKPLAFPEYTDLPSFCVPPATEKLPAGSVPGPSSP